MKSSRSLSSILFIVIFMSGFSGCQTTKSTISQTDVRDDQEKTIRAIAGSLRGKELSDAELKNLTQQIQTDEEARSAIQTISNSMGGKSVQVKYCPVCGKRFAARMELCPDDHSALKEVDE